MKLKQKIGAAVAVLLMTAGLAGCSGPASDPGEGEWGWYASEVVLKDGRTVPCVAVGQGGVTCDWGNAK